MPIKMRKSQTTAVGATSAEFTSPMAAGHQYRFTATVDCWVHVGATGASAEAETDNNHFCAKGQTLYLSGQAAGEQYVQVIRDSSVDGFASLSVIEGI